MAAKRKVGPPLFVQASIVVGEKETQPLRIMKENMDAAYLSLVQAQSHAESCDFCPTQQCD